MDLKYRWGTIKHKADTVIIVEGTPENSKCYFLCP